MRFLPLAMFIGCAGPPPLDLDLCDVNREARQSLQLGIVHVAGAYTPHPEREFLEAGADDARAFGASTLKVYLTPEYRTKYPQSWPEAHTLTELAATPAFRSLFSQPFETFVLTTYSFALGVSDPWKNTDDTRLLEAEAAELEELTRYLLTTYAHTGKRFVLQNWEGDWVLRSAGPNAAPKMIRWLNARQAGVSRARRAVRAEGVSVEHAVELNLVLRNDGPSVVRDVLPSTCTDSVSYSAWEALEVDTAMPLEHQRLRVRTRLSEAVQTISDASNGAPIALGEIGFAENEHPAGATQSLLTETLVTASQLGLSRAIYWQVYDNECAAGDTSCRGLWVVRPDGSASEAAQALKRFGTLAR